MSEFFSSLVITLREGIEGALAVAIVFLYLRKTGRIQFLSAVWWGVGLAIAASIAGAFLLEKLPVSGEILEGILMLIAAVFVGTMILWMWKSAKGLKREIEEKLDQISQSQEGEGAGSWTGIFLFVFLMIVREGIETAIFLSAVNLTTNALLSFIGGISGLILAALFGVFFVRGSIRIDLGRFFKITGIVLLLFVIQLLIGGMHELGEGGAIPIGSQEMAIIGPIVKNNALFLIGILLIPILMLLIPGKPRAVAAETGSNAEQRLARAQAKRQQTWRLAGAALSMCIVLFIAYDFVYGQNTKKISDPTPIRAVNGEVRVPLTDVSDGSLHRYILEGSKVRFFVLELGEGKMLPVLDACEICGSQGYVKESGSVICLNCDADINQSTIGKPGGCNPVPLAFQEKEGALIIREEDLRKEEKRF